MTHWEDTNFLKEKLAPTPITIANIYAPNTKQVAFFRQIGDLLTSFPRGILILGGDFNIPLNPILDTSNGTSTLPYRSLKQIKLQLQGLMLHDVWRTLNPQEKYFTYFSPLHQKYSKIDYFFFSQSDLQLLGKTTIEPMILSDHHPITMSLIFPEKILETKSWRLNTSILKDPIYIQNFNSCLEDYFTQNDNHETSLLNQWEAHKCVIRGEFIAKKSAPN